MNAFELTVRKHLSKEMQGTTEPFFELQSFCMGIEKNSLNMKVHQALTLKRQGHFDKAMLNIAEANRDQVTAIRTVQALLGRARGESCPEVVFEKFRQFEPFEIGISDADAVLSILADLDDQELQQSRMQLHDCELQKKDEMDYLSFLEDRLNADSAAEDIDKSKAALLSLARNLTELRNRILTKILNCVGEALNDTPSGGEKDRVILELSQNLFLIITSPILTKPATHVEAER